VKNDIRKQFIFKPDVQHQARANIEHQVKQYLNNSANFKDLQIIGVHIRRGKSVCLLFGYNGRIITRFASCICRIDLWYIREDSC
jgi:hypothetical protein